MTYHRGQYLESSIHDVFRVIGVKPSKNLITLWSFTADREIEWRISAIETAGYTEVKSCKGESVQLKNFMASGYTWRGLIKDAIALHKAQR